MGQGLAGPLEHRVVLTGVRLQEKKPEAPKLSKKKLRRMNRFTVAELKQVQWGRELGTVGYGGGGWFQYEGSWREPPGPSAVGGQLAAGWPSWPNGEEPLVPRSGWTRAMALVVGEVRG